MLKPLLWSIQLQIAVTQGCVVNRNLLAYLDRGNIQIIE
ncbi:hypothetical protein NSTC745_06498 [Nostoc sp. DSM 114161]|jgi:hypothetical protein